MMIRMIAAAALALACLSCTATLNRQQPWGEKVRVTSNRNLMEYRDVELLAVNDSMIYYDEKGLITCQKWDQVWSVRVLAYGSQQVVRWLCWLPTLALGIVWFADASHPGNQGEAVAAATLTAFTGMIMYMTGPHASFGSPPSVGDLERLRLFARYPQGLTDAQWRELLGVRGQKEFLARP
jgi:hypothetical protein